MSDLPLVSHASLDSAIAYRHGHAITVRRFLADVAALAALLPAGGHVLNLCSDRYRFAVGLCAALVAGKPSLLPPTLNPQTLASIRAFAPDAFCLHDGEAAVGGALSALDLPCLAYPSEMPAGLETTRGAPAVPLVPAERVMAYVFTSGSSGLPVPHAKTWGKLVALARASAARLGLDDGRSHALVGTVPPQHMFGFECTVVLALQAGLALQATPVFYPADIRAALQATPRPRVLVTSPPHLRALLLAGGDLPAADLLLSATAALPQALARQAEQRFGAPLLEIYGSTETGQIAVRASAHETTWELLPGIGLDWRTDPADEDGPVAWASGGHVERPVPMGDVLEQIDACRFLLHGRRADLVNIAGKRSSLAYLNHQLNTIEGVQDGCFFMPDEAKPSADRTGGTGGTGRTTRLIALAVAPGLDAVQVRRALRARIDPAFMPRSLLLVDSLPRNATGKLPRDVLAPLVDRLLAARRTGRPS